MKGRGWRIRGCFLYIEYTFKVSLIPHKLMKIKSKLDEKNFFSEGVYNTISLRLYVQVRKKYHITEVESYFAIYFRISYIPYCRYDRT